MATRPKQLSTCRRQPKSLGRDQGQMCDQMHCAFIVNKSVGFLRYPMWNRCRLRGTALRVGSCLSWTSIIGSDKHHDLLTNSQLSTVERYHSTWCVTVRCLSNKSESILDFPFSVLRHSFDLSLFRNFLGPAHSSHRLAARSPLRLSMLQIGLCLIQSEAFKDGTDCDYKHM